MPPYTDPSIAVRTWHEDAEHVQASVERVFLLHARGSATTERIARLVRNFDAFIRETPAPVGFFFTLTSAAKPPGDEDRRRMTDMMASQQDAIGGMAICLPLTGFTGAALRSVVSGVFLMNGPAYPVKVFGQEAEAQRWMSERLDTQLAGLQALCAHARARMEQA